MDAGKLENIFSQLMGPGSITAGQLSLAVMGFVIIAVCFKKKGSLALLALGAGIVLANLTASWSGTPDKLLSWGLSTGAFPLLLMVGLGAWLDFGELLAAPFGVMLGAAAQFGVFFTMIGALLLGDWLEFPISLKAAAAMGLIAPASGPIAIFSAAHLLPQQIGVIALATYVYRALLPWLLPPVVYLLTNADERRIAMKLPSQKKWPRSLAILLPLCALLLTRLLVPPAAPLMGALALGSLLREAAASATVIRRARAGFIHGATFLLGLAAGMELSAEAFFSFTSLVVFLLGLTATVAGCAFAILCTKLFNRCLTSRDSVNPLLAVAAIGAPALGPRLAEFFARHENGKNSLLPHAASAGIAGLLGAVIVAGMILALVPLLG